MGKGIVYILTNDAMPGIIKIGYTERTIKERLRDLDNTSVPLPFRCHYAIESERYKDIERFMHDSFSDFRIRDSREFFKMSPERAVAALRISGEKEIKENNEMIDNEGNIFEVSVSKNGMRKRFSFNYVGIPLGAELRFTRDESITCKVISEGEVEYEGESYSLSGLADKLLRKMGYKWKSVQGPSFFKFNDYTLYELKKQLDEAEEE